MTPEVQRLVDEFLQLIQGPLVVSENFDTEFHGILRQIHSLAPDSTRIRDLTSAVLSATAAEFGKSKIISHGRNKPFGYSGDFQIIDWTYTKAEPSEAARGRWWDKFYHRQIAPRAVCDRKDRFGATLKQVAEDLKHRPIEVLNVGSGPAREVLDGAHWAGLNPESLLVTCVDSDQRAIEYARNLLGEPWTSSVEFVHRNALRLRPVKKYDLAWSSGLFDYLEDKLAVHLLKIMFASVRPGGRLVVGNFADTHPTRPWIELCGDWFLIHRSSADLHSLVARAEILDLVESVSIEVDSLESVKYLVLKKAH